MKKDDKTKSETLDSEAAYKSAFIRIKELLGREPSELEAAIYAAGYAAGKNDMADCAQVIISNMELSK